MDIFLSAVFKQCCFLNPTHAHCLTYCTSSCLYLIIAEFLSTTLMSFYLCVCVCVSRRVLALCVALGLVCFAMVTLPHTVTDATKPLDWHVDPAHKKVSVKAEDTINAFFNRSASAILSPQPIANPIQSFLFFHQLSHRCSYS